MSDYTKAVDFAAKDVDKLTVFLGAEHNTEYDAIAVAVATKANKVRTIQDGDLVMMDADGDLLGSGIPSASLGRILDVQMITTPGSGTWTRPAGCTRIEVTACGPGGNGGGCSSSKPGASGSGGGGGASVWFILDTVPSSIAYKVGSNSTSGDHTVFGSVVTCERGDDGLTAPATGAEASGGQGGGQPGTTGVTSALAFGGSWGESGHNIGGSWGGREPSPKGGRAVLFGNARTPRKWAVGSTPVSGEDGLAPGTGGAGGAINTGGSNQAGGSGADGAIIVISYS